MGEILHQNSKGITMIRKDFKARSQVKVSSVYDGKSYHIRTYRFNNIHEPVEVPYCSWANLDCCGGWDFDEEYLDTAVQKGLKLFAGRTTSLRQEYFPNDPTMEEAMRQFDLLKETLAADVFAGVECKHDNPHYLYTFLCRTGVISDHINLDVVFGFYERLGVNLPDAVQREVTHLCSVEIKQYGANDAPFWYDRAETTAELITTGLLLGYPIESTASILQGY